jgi:hypothetical protein
MVTLKGHIIAVEVGDGEETPTSITNCKFIRWKTNHTATPRFLPSSKAPVGWLQSHFFVEGEMGLVSKDATLDSYVPSTADADIIPHFVALGEDTANNAVTYTFEGLIVENVEKGIDGSGEPVFVYKLKAYYVTEG